MVLEGDAETVRGGKRGGRRALDRDAAGVGLLQGGDQAQHRALAAAARAEDGDELAVADLERHVVQRHQRSAPAGRESLAGVTELDRRRSGARLARRAGGGSGNGWRRGAA